jgi:glycogen synthase kinase 3 beta
VYDPSKRISGYQSMCHPYFDELREDSNIKMPNGNSYVDIFNFSNYEKE